MPVLRHIEIHHDQNQYFIENKENGDFFEINEAAATVIEMMQSQRPLAEIQAEAAQLYPEEKIDVYEFIEQLRELDLLQTEAAQPPSNRVRKKTIWDRIPVIAARLVFNKKTFIFFALLLVGNIGLLITYPQLFPSYTDLFIVDTIALTYLLWFGVSTILVLIHEFGHILAARSYNLSPRLGIGHRWFYLVMETDLSQVWRLSRHDRYLPLLGGIAFDQILLLLAFMIKLSFAGTFAAQLAGLAAFQIMITLLFQCCLFMKTDLYYVLENMTGTHNLLENTKNWLSRYLPWLRKDQATVMFDGEEKTVRIYSIVYICGVIVMVGLFVFFFIPQMFQIFEMARTQLSSPIHSAPFWDGIVLILFPLLVFLLIFYSWQRNRKEAQR